MSLVIIIQKKRDLSKFLKKRLTNLTKMNKKLCGDRGFTNCEEYGIIMSHQKTEVIYV